MLEWHSVLRKGSSEQENKIIMMRNVVDFVRNAALMLTSHHVRLCLIQIARIISLQKVSLMRKCGYHNQVQDLIRGSIPYKFALVLKANDLHLELCFVELENAYQEDERSSWHKYVHVFFQENA